MRIFVASLGVVIGLCGVSAQSDLDELMSQVLSHRDENWKKLQQYVLEEREAFQLAATGGARLYGFERDYSWFVREGFFIRSPIRADGVTIAEGDRRRAEDEWLARQRRRESRRAARDGTTSELTDPTYYPALGQLFNQHIFDALVSPVASAAFQLAVWEIRYDSAPGHLDYNVTTGAFTAVGDLPTIVLANSWLSGLAGPTRTVTLLHNAEAQDFITIGSPGRDCCREVPEPTPLPLLALGLGGMAYIATRRSRKARGL